MTSALLTQLQHGRCVVVCGSGGVGKTTMSAALGVSAAANFDRRVLVLTVDPARRLADALGIESFGNQVVEVAAQTFIDAGVQPKGRLFAAMIDTKASWDELIARCAPNDEVREKVLSNFLYRNLTERFINSHDYIAIERLYDAYQSDDYDLIIVDTPPSRNALDILDAPQRMQEFFASRFLKLLTAPGKSRLLSFTSKPFFAVADRILGAGFLGDISEFFTLFRTMEIGFVERAKRVETMLTNSETAFTVVTTLESAPLHEAQFLINELRARKFVLSSVIANRVIAKALVSEVDEALPQLVQATQNDQFVQRIASATATPVEQIIAVITSIVDKSHEILVDARAERSDLTAFAAECAQAGTQTIESALQGGNIGDLRGLLVIGQNLLPA